MKANWTSMVIVAVSVTVATAASVNNQRVTTQAPPSSGCVVPPGTPSLLTSDGTVYLYFESTVTNSDALRNDWIAPDGSLISGGNWGISAGSYCFIGASLGISNLPPQLLGNWQARVWDNGAVLFTVPFTVSSTGTPASGPTFPPPQVTTSQRTLPANVSGYPAYSAQAQIQIDGTFQSNPFYFGGSWQCTRYAWGRAVEKTGVTLAFAGGPGNQNGGQWHGNVITGGSVSLGSTPRQNSIAVWTGGQDANGHVAFVEDINADGSLIVTEANYPVGSVPHQDVLSPTNSSGYQIATRDGGGGTQLRLAGFIYLTTYEGYLDTNSNTCATSVSGWVADHAQLNTPLNVEVFDGEQYLSSVYANAWRQDVANYLNNSGFNAFTYQLPPITRDGQTHQIWARVSGSYTDLAHAQSVSCGARSGNLQLTFNPSYVTNPTSTADCGTSFSFTFAGAETTGLGINLTNLSISPEGLSWNLPTLGIPGRVGGGSSFSTGLSWCRAPGISTFTITGTDDNGTRGSWSGTITFALQ